MGRLSFLLIMKDLLVVFRNPWDPKCLTYVWIPNKTLCSLPNLFWKRLMVGSLAMSSYETDHWGRFHRPSSKILSWVQREWQGAKDAVNWEDFREKVRFVLLYLGGICRTKTSKDTSDLWSLGFLKQNESFSTCFWSWTAYGYFLGALNCWRKSDSGSPQRRRKRHMDYDCPFVEWCMDIPNGGLEKASTLERWEECGFTLPLENIPQLIVSFWCVQLQLDKLFDSFLSSTISSDESIWIQSLFPYNFFATTNL